MQCQPNGHIAELIHKCTIFFIHFRMHIHSLKPKNYSITHIVQNTPPRHPGSIDTDVCNLSGKKLFLHALPIRANGEHVNIHEDETLTSIL